MESDIYNDTALQQYEGDRDKLFLQICSEVSKLNWCLVVEQLLPFFERALEGVDKYVGGDPNAPLVLADFGVSVGNCWCWMLVL